MYSIRFKILTIGMLFIVLMALAFVLYFLATTKNYKLLRLDGIEKTVEFETEKVNKIISEIEKSAVFLALGGAISHNTDFNELIEKLGVNYLSSLPDISGGGLWYEPYAFNKEQLRAGFYTFYDKELGKMRLDESFSIEEYDYFNLGWYREIIDNIKKTNQVVWTKPYIDDGSQNLMTTVGSGIFDENNKIIAISILDWEIDSVVNELIAIKPTENSFVLLCVPDKDYVISSTRTRSVTGASIKDLPWDITADSFIFDGVSYKRFGRFMDNGWLLSIQIPENEIFAEMEFQNRRYAIVIAMSSAIMILTAFLLISKFINSPIRQLSSDISTLELGNLDTHIRITTNDEIGQLARILNKITGDLKKSIEDNLREHALNERVSAELNVAATIQASMLPSIFPPFPERDEFDIFASMFPAKEVGGDFYDFFFIDKNNLAIVIADVSGKGVPAALFMVITKTLIKNCSSCKTPKAVFNSVNEKLCDGNDNGMFVTAFIGIYNIPTGKFTYVNAGHNPPLIKKKGKNFEFLETDPCIVLAFLKDSVYREESVILEKDDVLFFYTDGVTEAMDSQRKMFTDERLLSVSNEHLNSSCEELINTVKNKVDDFTNGTQQADDITMLAFKVNNVTNSLLDNSRTIVKKKITIKAVHSNLYKLINFIEKETKNFSIEENIRKDIEVAAEEIFMNITKYAYKPMTGNVSISLFIYDKIKLVFVDTGKPYDLSKQPDPDLKLPAGEREIGGLGIYLIKKLVDDIKYSRTDNKNVLVITKNYEYI